MIKHLFTVLLITLLAACATPYDTKKSGWTGGMGFSETQLGPDLWQVDFTGNNYTDRDTTKKYVLKKAAEIALREGYPYFKTVEAQTAKDTVGATGGGYFGSFGAGQTYANTSTLTNITAQLLKTKEGQAGVVYDANFLVGSVSTK
ncbi:MAG: hypothetical protein JWM78_1644 [Verrucomicrobiaceae bacterium]|nr:hypothetical protein [Verrucomicrobiaceae bacterium]